MTIETKNIPPDLTGGTIRLLGAVSDKPGVNRTEAAEMLGLSSHALIECANMAETCGLIEVAKSDDFRKRELYLTKAGQVIVDGMKGKGAK